MIPGIDAVGLLPDGEKVYFVVHDTPFGTMAEQVVADRRRCVPLPEGVDDAQIAAGMNPAMSSWIALRLRAPIQKGQGVFILGATGNAGQMAIQVAKRLGAGRVVAAGRQVQRLEKSSADHVLSLSGDPASVGKAIADAASEVDIVVDYLWGEPAAHAMMSVLTARGDRGKALNWIQIGSVAGPTMALPSVALRSANLRVLGSGQGFCLDAGHRRGASSSRRRARRREAGRQHPICPPFERRSCVGCNVVRRETSGLPSLVDVAAQRRESV